MVEGYWERKRRQLNEDHTFRRAQSGRDICLIRSQYEIDQLTERIERAADNDPEVAFSKKFRRLGPEWMIKKASTLTEISDNPDLSEDIKEAWRRTLDRVILTAPDEVALTNLLGQVQAEAIRQLLAGSAPAWLRLSVLARSIAGLIEIHEAARAEL